MSRLSWSTRDGDDGVLGIAMRTHGAFDRLAARGDETQPPTLADSVWAIVRGTRSGRFPARPISCEYCGFEASCRIERPARG